jgi:DUF438 domain-containing protein
VLISDVAPTEIAQMERALIAEGMPEEEIKKPATSMLKSSEWLDTKVMPGMPAGHPVHTFMLETDRPRRLGDRMHRGPEE